MAGLFDQFMAYIDANTPRNTRKPVNAGTVIDQGLLGGRIGQVPQRAQEMYQGLLGAPAELAALGSPAMRSQVDQAITKPQPANKQQWMDAGMELSGMAPVGGLVAHTVYHGSPHKFDKFDMSKIGTGEGGQAYGHGLYFSEAADVAKGYAKDRRQYMLRSQGRDIGMSDADYQAADIAWMIQQYGPVEKGWLESELGARGLPIETKKKVNSFLKAPIDRSTTNSTYKVDIPDEAIPRMLDGDIPLSQQSAEVQAAMRKAGYTDESFGMTGSELYEDTAWDLGGTAGAKQATEMFRNAGIPGLRYSGEGATNYVLFDDQLPRILEVNGKPTGLLSWAEEAKKKK